MFKGIKTFLKNEDTLLEFRMWRFLTGAASLITFMVCSFDEKKFIKSVMFECIKDSRAL